MKVIVEGIGEKRLDQRMFVAKGGEGEVYVSQGIAYKICEPGKAIPASKIAELGVLTDQRIIRPERMLYDSQNRPVGYTMRAVRAPWTPCHLFTREFLSDQGISHQDIAQYAKELREIVEHAHQHGMLLVDLNELNFLMDKAGGVFAIDVNSWQTKSFPATAIMDSVRDRHSSKFTNGTDWFSWAVVTFQMFIGQHPYKGQHPDYRGTVVERMHERMRNCVSVFHDGARPLAATDPFDVVPRGLLGWYREIFESKTREPPPTRFEEVAVHRPKTVGVLVGGDVVLTELQVHAHDIQRVWSHGDQMAVGLADGSIVIDGKAMSLSIPVSNLHFDTTRGWMAVTNTQHRHLAKVGDPSGRTLAQYESMFVSSGGDLYGVLHGKLMLIGPIGDTHVANVLNVPSAVFQDDGVLMQNLIGRWHITFLKSSRACVMKPIPELDGVRPIKARMSGQMLVLSGDRAGTMVRYELQFSTTGDYDIREFHGVSSPDFTFAVNEAGVCVLVDADDEVAAFRAHYGSSTRSVLSNASIDGSFRIWSCGQKIMATRGKVLYRVEKR